MKKDETYYLFKYPDESNVIKDLIAIVLKISANDKDLPQMKKNVGKNWIGVRVRNNGIITDIIINMFAVTYPEQGKADDAKEFFIGYGSALRRNDVSYFSSLSKLFVIQKTDDKKV